MTLTGKELIIVSKEIEGVAMGVLHDGTPFLTLRGLTKICGTAPSTIITRSQEWTAGDRTGKLPRFLLSQGFDEDRLYVELTYKGRTVHAVPDNVCMLILEYYAFEVGNELARNNYRLLARKTLRDYIYTFTGYDPRLAIPPAWRHFHDRLLLNVLPVGYFSVFREMADFIIAAIRAGLALDEKTIPDISVGQTWAAHWCDRELDEKFGERIKYDHNYPEYYAASDSNPQPAWAYPVDAIGEFRRWLHDTYLPEKFPKYLKGKVKKGTLPGDTARLVIAAVTGEHAALPAGGEE